MSRKPEVEERDWDRLIEELGDGECTPFIGAGACVPTLPTTAALCEKWSKKYDYPFKEVADLPRIMEYAAIAEGEHVTIKRRLCNEFMKQRPPDFTIDTEPHALLAKFPLPVYLTTNYDDFMVRALEHAGKRPYAATCPWYKGAPPSGLKDSVLSADTPIVYHLHGRCMQNSRRTSESLVLTESDYLEFLVNLGSDRAADGKNFIPTPILPSFTERPLLFIGYSLRDLTFRVIFEGLRNAVPRVQRRQHVSVQLPLVNKGGVADDRVKDYLVKYFRTLDICVYWGSAEEFCTELRRRLP
ncbi:MAG: SIR2 family NAD-dependent protein deacylase [Pseudonocardiaceae bacterium]